MTISEIIAIRTDELVEMGYPLFTAIRLARKEILKNRLEEGIAEVEEKELERWLNMKITVLRRKMKKLSKEQQKENILELERQVDIALCMVKG